jgi:hypothetical protein
VVEQIMGLAAIDHFVQPAAEEPQVFLLSDEEKLLCCSIYMGVWIASLRSGQVSSSR